MQHSHAVLHGETDSVAHKLGSIHLPPQLVPYVAARVRQLNLDRSEYLRILLSNYLHGPSFGLPHVLRPDRKLKRSSMQVSMPVQLRREGQKAAARWDLSFSALMESLIIHDAERDDDDDTLLIHPVRGKPTPRFLVR